MQKAVFFDRDGVINNDDGLYYVFRKEDFKLNKGALDLIKELSARGFLIFIITNQGGIARGLYNKEDADFIHLLIENECERAGVRIAEIYYCPHHPDFGNCICRKPDTLMLEKTIARFDIDCANSYFIGDRDTDVQSANKAGIKPILIKPNSNLMDCLPLIPK